MVRVTGSSSNSGTNRSANDTFGSGDFWFEWIELSGTSTNSLSQAGFDTSNGDRGAGQTVYNAGTANAVDVPGQSGSLGNSGDDFAVRLTTTLTVTTGGTYTFDLGSDDGSRLYVDGVEVVENDGLHAFRTRSGTVNLTEGQHEVVIIFFERGGQAQLQSSISGPDYASSTALQDANVSSNAGSDSVSSGAGNDSIEAGAGNDTVDAGSGSDTINAGTGNDSIEAGAGGDVVSGVSGNNTIDGGEGADSIFGGSDGDSIRGAAGDDRIEGRNGADTIDGGSGDDLITGYDAVSISSGNPAVQEDDGADDSLLGGTGNDTILGGEGEDVIDGGGDADSIDGGADDDQIQGGDGDDTILGGGGADSISDTNGSNEIDGGLGNDTVSVVGNGSNTVAGGAGDDSITVFVSAAATNSIDAGIGADFVQTGDSTDTIIGGDGDDTLDAGRGDDSISGGADNDEIRGFEGDDTIDGGSGDDQIDGGSGSDEQTGGDGFDVFLVTAGDDVITDFNTGTGQNFDDDNQLNNDFINLAPYYDSFFEARDDLDDDGLLNQSNAGEIVTGGTVDYGDNTALPGTIAFTGVPSADFTFDNVNLVCFTAGALIATARGTRPIETLKIGDHVLTLDHGIQRIRWIGARTMTASELTRHERLRPILFRAGSLGQGLPTQDLRVSPQHRMVVRSPIVRRMFDVDEVFVAAKFLCGLPGIERDDTVAETTYIHLLLDQHEVLLANGAPAESLYTGPMAMQALDREAAREVTEILPDAPLRGAQVKARLSPRGQFARKLIERHAKNGKPPIGSFNSRPAQPRSESRAAFAEH